MPEATLKARHDLVPLSMTIDALRTCKGGNVTRVDVLRGTGASMVDRVKLSEIKDNWSTRVYSVGVHRSVGLRAAGMEAREKIGPAADCLAAVVLDQRNVVCFLVYLVHFEKHRVFVRIVLHHIIIHLNGNSGTWAPNVSQLKHY